MVRLTATWTKQEESETGSSGVASDPLDGALVDASRSIRLLAEERPIATEVRIIPRMRWTGVSVVAIVAATLVTSVSGSPTARASSSREAKKCGYGFVHVQTHGRHRCVAVWKFLRRPLRIPTIAPGSPCPKTPPSGDIKTVASELVGTAFGPGPVFPGLGFSQTADLSFNYPAPPGSLDYGTGWSGQKVMWILADRYSGPALVRGRQLDGPHPLRIDGEAERRLVGSGGHPSTTKFRAPGCYGYQVDGLRFSFVIVFQARAWPT